MGNALVRRGDDPACLRALAVPAGAAVGRLARPHGPLPGRTRCRALARSAALLQLSLASDRQSGGRLAGRALVEAGRAGNGGQADRDEHPAADRRRVPVGRAGGSSPPAADRVVGAAVRVRPSVPVRVRQLHAVDGARLPCLRAMAAARAAQSDRASRDPVRANLVPAVRLPHLRLGIARDPRLLGRGGAPA